MTNPHALRTLIEQLPTFDVKVYQSTQDVYGSMVVTVELNAVLAALSALPETPQLHNAELHNEIMNIRCEVPEVACETDWVAAYRLGHRDARHAAAELVVAPPPPSEEPEK